MITINYLFFLYIIQVYIDHVFILGLWQLATTHMLKLWQLKAKCSQIRVKLLSLMNPMLYLLSMTCTYACFSFQYFGKSRMGTRLLESGGVKLVINQSVVRVELVTTPKDRSCPTATCGLRLYPLNKVCYILGIMILPLFVAICEIWLPGLTYGVYLVLSLKPGATVRCCPQPPRTSHHCAEHPFPCPDHPQPQD